MSLLILTGDNAYQISSELKQVRAKFKASFPEGEMLHLDASEGEWQQLKSVLEARSLFAENRLVVAEGFLLGHEVEEVEKLADEMRADQLTELIVVEKSLDKRTKLYNWLKKQPEAKDYAKLNGSSMFNWASDYAKLAELKLSRENLETVLRYSNEDQFNIANNLDKLALVGGEVGAGVINELVQDQSKTSSFSLIESAFRGDSLATENNFQALIDQGEEPHAILGLLAWQINLIVTASHVPVSERRNFAAEFKISEYAFSKSASLEDKLSKGEIKELLESVAKLDVDSKSKSIDLERSLLNLLLKTAAKFS
jgi:DNA polymerase III delta subunit